MGAPDGTVAVVTGGSRGIGRAVVERLAHDGAHVVVGYTANAAAAQDVVEKVAADGGRATALAIDVRSVASIADFFAQAEAAAGAPDVVVHAAAISVFKPHALVTEEEFDAQMDTNVKGTFFVLAEAARRVRDGGRIIAFSTGGTKSAVPAGGLYAASKAATERFVASLAKELGDRRVTVNAVAPGVTNTDGLVLDAGMVDMLVAQTPLGRLGEPGDVAEVVRFLAAPASGWVNGQVVHVNGGML